MSGYRTIPEISTQRRYFASPDRWREEFIYFLLVDRFSDGRVEGRPPLSHARPPAAAAESPPDGPIKPWRWCDWAISGRNRFQGGTINGVRSQLSYLRDLGVTAIWLSPVCRQRATGTNVNHRGDGTDDPMFPPGPADLRDPSRPFDIRDVQVPMDEYHAYSPAGFLDVDPRFGTMDDLKALIAEAHGSGIRVILDIVINHSGVNFAYDVQGMLSRFHPPYWTLGDGTSTYDTSYRYPFGGWLNATNDVLPVGAPLDYPDSGVWPAELQNPDFYNRRGDGNYGNGDPDKYLSEFRIADFYNRDFYYPDEPESPVLDLMVKIWSYWIAETDCDGFRVDTYKHVPWWVSVAFAERIRKFAIDLGKTDFLIAGEVGGSDPQAATYLTIPGVSVLSLDERRRALRELAAGNTGYADAVLTPAFRADDLRPMSDPDRQILNGVTEADLRDRVLTSIDDHDGLGLDPQRRIAGRYGDYAVIPAVALLLFTPGVPCLYYGTEQALTGPLNAGDYLNEYGWNQPRNIAGAHGGDRYLREAMFGPEHPRPAGLHGRDHLGSADRNLPGFGPSGTYGQHAFDPGSPWYRAVAAMAKVRKEHRHVLAGGSVTRITRGRVDGGRYGAPLPSHVIAWFCQDPAGPSAVVVVDVAPPGTDTPHAIDLELPAMGRRPPTWNRRLLIDGNGPDDATIPVNGTPQPQSGICYLAAGSIAPGNVAIFL